MIDFQLFLGKKFATKFPHLRCAPLHEMVVQCRGKTVVMFHSDL